MFFKKINIGSLVFCLFSLSICSCIAQENQFIQREILIEDSSAAIHSFKDDKLYVNLDYIEFFGNEMYLQVNENEYLPLSSVSRDSQGSFVNFRSTLDPSVDMPKYFRCPIPKCPRWVITSSYRFRQPICPDHGVPMI